MHTVHKQYRKQTLAHTQTAREHELHTLIKLIVFYQYEKARLKKKSIDSYNF